MSLYGSELRKLRTTRTTWVITAVAAGLVAMQTSLSILFADLVGTEWTGTARDIADAVDGISIVFPIALVVGLLSMTTEFRFGTVGRTLQLTPSRTRVVLTKMGAGVGYAIVLAVLGLAVTAVSVLLASLRDDVTLTLGGEVGTAAWQIVVGLALVTVFGVALGSLIRNQVVAVTASLVWFLVVENVLLTLVPRVGRWLPFQALQATFVSDQMREAFPQGMAVPYLPQLTGLVVFLGYVLVAVVAAVALLRYRDV
jgi:ABC-2 type transport system permease protein